MRIYNGIGADKTYTMPKPQIDFNTVLSEIAAKFVNQATGKDIDETIEDLKTDVDLVKEQTDKEYTLWFFDYVPTLSNYRYLLLSKQKTDRQNYLKQQ